MTRVLMYTLIALAILGGCVDFGLESRRFRCDDKPALCGEGWRCGMDGFCTREPVVSPDAAAADAMPPQEICDNGEDDDDNGHTDCRDEACGTESCDDSNVCTSDTCPASGTCEREPLTGSCGTGCTCEPAGTPTEAACGDREDNDSDGATDCNDSDCPACVGGLMCCPDGGCRTNCG